MAFPFRSTNLAGGQAPWPPYTDDAQATTPAPFQNTGVVPPITTIPPYPHGTAVIDQVAEGTEYFAMLGWGDLETIRRHGWDVKTWGIRVTISIEAWAETSTQVVELLESTFPGEPRGDRTSAPIGPYEASWTAQLTPGFSFNNATPSYTPLDQNPVAASLEWNLSVSIGPFLYFLPDGRIFAPITVQFDGKFYYFDGETPFAMSSYQAGEGQEDPSGNPLEIAGTTKWRVTAETTNPEPNGQVILQTSDGGGTYATGGMGRGAALGVDHGVEMTLAVELWHEELNAAMDDI